MELVKLILGGSDAPVVTMLLLFITALMTKRIVPWYVHEAALKKLQRYEDAAPDLISEINNLLDIVAEQRAVPEKRPTNIPTNPQHRPKSPQRAKDR